MVAPTFGLGVDEAHYVLYGKNLDFSYFDHPPLVGWTHTLLLLFGEGEFFARLPAIIIGAVSSYLAFLFMLQVSKDEKIALFGVIALNSSPMINALFVMLLPDTFLIPTLFLLIFATLRLEKNPTLVNYVYGGVLLGVAGLAKYSAILLVFPIIFYFIFKKRFEILLNVRIIAALIVALFIISPVIYWNFQNDFASFKYQGDHVLGSQDLDFMMFAKSFAAQFGSYSPFLFILSVWAFVKSRNHYDDSIRLAFYFSLVMALFFIYSSFYKIVLPHWSVLFYVLFIPLSIYLFWGRQRLIRWSVGISAFIVLFLYFELAFKAIPSAHKDIYGWGITMSAAKEELNKNQNPNKALAVANWTHGSRALYYSQSDVFVIDERRDQFDMWEKSSPVGKDLLFVVPQGKDTASKCTRSEKVKTVELKIREKKVQNMELIWCYGFEGKR